MPVADPAEAHRLVQSVLHAQAVPAAIEVDWAPGDGSVRVLLEGRDEGVAGRAATVRGLLGDDGDGVRRRAGAVPLGRHGHRRRPLDRAQARRSRSPGSTDVLSAAADTGVTVRGSAGAGVAYAALPPGTPVDAARTALDRLRGVCTGHGGSAVVVDAPADVKAGLDVWGPVPALDLMRRVKDQFDPDHRLAPGRFVGGI